MKIKIQITIQFILLIICAWRTLSANEIPNFIFETAINSHELIAAKQNLFIKKQLVRTVTSAWLPNISADISQSWVRDDSTTSTFVSKSVKVTHPQTYSLQVDQPIWNGGRTNIDKNVANFEYQAEKYRYLKKLQTKMIELVSLNSEIIKLKKSLYYTENNIKILRYHLNSSKIRFKVGEISETDVFKSESRLSSVAADKIKISSDLKIAKQKYNSNFKDKYSASVTLEPLKIIFYTKEEMIESNYDLISERLISNSLSEKYKKQKKVNWPTLSAKATLTQSFQEINKASESTEVLAKLQFTVPLYDGGINSSAISIKKLEMVKSKNTYQALIKDNFLKLTSAYGEYKSSNQRITAIKLSIKHAKKTLESTKKEVNIGTKSIGDLLDSEKELLDARLKLIGEEEKIILLTYKINGAMGKLVNKNIFNTIHFKPI